MALIVNGVSGVINCFLFVGVPLALFFLSKWQLKRGDELSSLSRRMWIVLRAVSSVPLFCTIFVLIFLVTAGFPFTSGIAARASAPTGEEAFVIQEFEGFVDGYAVGLYVRAPGGPWTRHSLSYEDGHWWNCRIEFKDGKVFVYDGSRLVKSLSILEAAAPAKYPSEQIPGNFSPEQVLAILSGRGRLSVRAQTQV
jgi:hypothetical protein